MLVWKGFIYFLRYSYVKYIALFVSWWFYSHITLVFEKKICKKKNKQKTTFLYIFLCKNSTPTLAPAYTEGTLFKEIWIITIYGFFQTNLGIYWDEDSKICFLYKFLCKNMPPNCDQPLPLGIKMWTNFDIHCLGMLPHKLKHSCSISF